MHWVAKYIGLPWINHKNDCYQLVRLIYKDQLNITLPDVPIDATSIPAVVEAFKSSPARQVWRPIPNPKDMCLVFMGRKRSSHCGLWLDIDGGGIVSSYQDSGVVREDLFTVKQRQFHHFEFFEYVG